MSSYRSARGQLGLSAGGLWSWGHLLGMAVPLLMVLSAAIGPALVTRPNRGLGTVQSVVIASTLLQAENSRAAPIGARWERSLVESSEIGASAADLHRTFLPWVRLLCRQDAKRLEDANRL